MGGPLVSKLFRENQRLQNCAQFDPQHVIAGERGEHVALIQAALVDLGYLNPEDPERTSKYYGRTTATAVGAYKTDQGLLNYKNQIDEIVGIKTIAALDRAISKFPLPGPPQPQPTKPDQPAPAAGPPDHLTRFVSTAFIVRTKQKALDDRPPNGLVDLLADHIKARFFDPFETSLVQPKASELRLIPGDVVRKTVLMEKLLRSIPDHDPAFDIFELERTYTITYGAGARTDKVQVKVLPTMQVSRFGREQLEATGREFTADQPSDYRQLK